jgi:hypothetical protein
MDGDGIISSSVVAGAWCSDFLGFDLCGVVVAFCWGSVLLCF